MTGSSSELSLAAALRGLHVPIGCRWHWERSPNADNDESELEAAVATGNRNADTVEWQWLRFAWATEYFGAGELRRFATLMDVDYPGLAFDDALRLRTVDLQLM